MPADFTITFISPGCSGAGLDIRPEVTKSTMASHRLRLCAARTEIRRSLTSGTPCVKHISPSERVPAFWRSRRRDHTPCDNILAYPLNPRTANNRQNIFLNERLSTRNFARPSYLPLGRSTSSVLSPLRRRRRDRCSAKVCEGARDDDGRF